MDYLHTLLKFIESTNENDNNTLVFLELYKLICTFPPEEQHSAIYAFSNYKGEITAGGAGLSAKYSISESEEMFAIMNVEQNALPYLCRIAEDARANKVPDRDIYKMIWREIRRSKLLSSDIQRALALAFFLNYFISDPEDSKEVHAPLTEEEREIASLADESLFSEFRNMISSPKGSLNDMLDGINARLTSCATVDEQRRCLFNLISACADIGNSKTSDSENGN